MLSPKNRLKKKKDFERVYKKGQGLKQDFLILRFRSNSLNDCRFGIVVSKKVANKANERNLIKRRIREIIKEFIAETQSNVDAVIICSPGISKKTSFQEIKKSLEELFVKAGIVRPDIIKR